MFSRLFARLSNRQLAVARALLIFATVSLLAGLVAIAAQREYTSNGVIAVSVVLTSILVPFFFLTRDAATTALLLSGFLLLIDALDHLKLGALRLHLQYQDIFVVGQYIRDG